MSNETKGPQPAGEVRMYSGLLYALLDGDFPVGTKLYVHPPPSAPVGDSLLQTALRNLPQYISKSGLVGPDMHSAMQCFEVLRDALAQQPTPPSAPVGVEAALSLLRAGHWREVHVGRRYMRLEVTYDYAAWERLMEQVEAALAQQPAAVDEAMVFRLAVWMAEKDGHDDPHHLIWEGSPPEPWGEVWNRYEDDARSALTAALATQPRGSDNDR